MEEIVPLIIDKKKNLRTAKAMWKEEQILKGTTKDWIEYNAQEQALLLKRLRMLKHKK